MNKYGIANELDKSFSPLTILSLTCDCRLYGSYEALKGGNVADALTDFTGGICEGYTLRGVNSNVPRNIVNILFKALDRLSLIGCGISVSLSLKISIIIKLNCFAEDISYLFGFSFIYGIFFIMVFVPSIRTS